MNIPYNKLNDPYKQKIIDAFNFGSEIKDIQSQLSISERAIARVLKEAGINTKRKNRYTLNENYFDVIDSQVKSYLLGLIAADGCVTNSNYIAFESIDQELTQLMKKELNYTGEIRVIQPHNYSPHYRINFSSQTMAKALFSYSIEPGRTFSGKYYFPEKQYLASYILGYFDGDGCAYVNKGRSGGLVCIVGSYEFTESLAKHLGMGTVAIHKLKKVYYWRIYSQENIEKFYNLLYQYPLLGLDRKKQKIIEILRSYKHG